MFACRITGNNDGQKFVRTYYEPIQMDHNEFRGAAKPDHLRAQLPADAFVSVYINGTGMTLARASGKEASVELMKFTRGGQSGHFQVGDLDFVAELLEFPDPSDPGEGTTIYKNSNIVVVQRGNGVQVTHKGDADCMVYISASNEFNNRLNVLPSVNTDMRVTNNKHRPMIQFLPDKHQ